MNDVVAEFIAQQANDLAAKDSEIARLQDAVYRLEAHLKAVRSEIEQSWQRVQAALSKGEGQ